MSDNEVDIPDGDHYGMGHCAVCGAKCQYGFLMCGRHWRQVPRRLQNEVYERLEAWEQNTGTLLALRSAQADAVGAVVS